MKINNNVSGWLKGLCLAGISLATVSSSVSAAVIDTTPAVLASMGLLAPFGEDPSLPANVKKLGQTFIAPAIDTQLNSFAFYLTQDTSALLNYQANIYQWNGVGTTGAALYTSGPLVFDVNNVDPDTGFEQVKFSTGGLKLTGGGQYVASLSVIANNVAIQNAGWGMAVDADGNFTNAYSSGQLMVLADSQVSWQGFQAWSGLNDFPDTIDTAFRLEFSDPNSGGGTPVPTPGSLSLLAMGVIALLARHRRRAARNLRGER